MYRSFKLMLIVISSMLLLSACSGDPSANQEKDKESLLLEKTTNESSADSLQSVETTQILDSQAMAQEINDTIPLNELASKEKANEEEDPEEIARKKRREKRRKERAKKRQEAKKKPVIDFSEMTHRYGTIQQGEKVNHRFKFKNTGKSDLIIKDVKVSCGCTHPSYPFIPIAPGEEGYIGVNFDSAGRLGKQKPTVTVVTNARPKTYKLYLEGYVDAERATSTEEKDTL